MESLHPPGHAVTLVLLQDSIKQTLYNSTNVRYVRVEFIEIARKL